MKKTFRAFLCVANWYYFDDEKGTDTTEIVESFAKSVADEEMIPDILKIQKVLPEKTAQKK